MFHTKGSIILEVTAYRYEEEDMAKILKLWQPTNTYYIDEAFRNLTKEKDDFLKELTDAREAFEELQDEILLEFLVNNITSFNTTEAAMNNTDINRDGFVSFDEIMNVEDDIIHLFQMDEDVKVDFEMLFNAADRYGTGLLD